MSSRISIFALVVLASGLLGDACFYPFTVLDLGISIIENPDVRCSTVSSASPPGLDFDGTGRLWVLDLSPPAIIPFDVDVLPPTVSALGPFRIPPDSDGNGTPESFPAAAPLLEGIKILTADEVSAGLAGFIALVTATSYDEVLYFRADTGALIPQPVSVPASFALNDYPFLPLPGSGARPQTGISARACLWPVDGADSLGFPIAIPPSSRCRDEVNSYYSSSTSGAVIANQRLFVSVANPGDGAGGPEPQYLPGAVLAYKIPLGIDSGIPIEPDAATPFIFTQGFNPTHLTRYDVETVAGPRRFVLVTVSGAIGTVQDDPLTETVEGGFKALTDAAIEVIDASADPPRLAATIPLGLAGLTGGLAIDRGSGIAVVGSAVKRQLLAVDLAPLADPDLPTTGDPVVLDGTSPGLASAVLRDATNPILLPALPTGGAGTTCPGYIGGVAFNDAGNLIYATDFCDGTLHVVEVLATPLAFNPSAPIVVTAPIDSSDVVKPRGPGAIAVHPGMPKIDYTGPDVFVLVGQPEGLVCALDIESAAGSF